jgi:hypothetical protein
MSIQDPDPDRLDGQVERDHHAVNRASALSWCGHYLMVPILLLALTLRLAPWGDNRFLEDEALYAHWGLQIATGADPMLDQEPVDKPPLHPYALALSFLALGRNETAARLPSLLASTAGIALVYAIAKTLYRDEPVGLLAAVLLALSPFDLLFASTAFTDPLMSAWMLGALWAATAGRLGAAGLLASLAGATKQQGFLFLPLVAAVGMSIPDRLLPYRGRSQQVRHFRDRLPSQPGTPRWRVLWRSGWLRFALGAIVVIVSIVAWDLMRVQRPGFLAQGLISYGGLGPAQPQALGQRGAAWLRLLGAFWVSPWFNGLLVAAFVTWQAGGLVGWWAPWSRIDHLLVGFFLGFLLLHWLVGFQVWDRYLLGLVPLAAILAARSLLALGRAPRQLGWRWACAIGLGMVLSLSLGGPVHRASRSELPLGGDHGAYDGIDQLAAYIRTTAPEGSVLYHHWLGYHYRFYLYGAPLRLHWHPDLDDLLRDATIYRREPRYIAFPSWQDAGPTEQALEAASISLRPVLETVRRDGTTSFRLYRLEGP